MSDINSPEALDALERLLRDVFVTPIDAEDAADTIAALRSLLSQRDAAIVQLQKWRQDADRNIAIVTAERDATIVKLHVAERRYGWAANELLACDYGDNTQHKLAWIVYGWRSLGYAARWRIYGPNRETAVDNEIYKA